VVVGRRYLDHGDIDVHGTGAKQLRDVHHVYGRVVRASLGHGFPACRGHKKRLQTALVEATVCEPGLSNAQDLQNFDVREAGQPFLKALSQMLRLAASRTDEHPVPASDNFERLASALFPPLINRSPFANNL
jgi:hypothetical protein